MTCPECNSQLKVAYTLSIDEENLIIRKRECVNCKKFFYTDEAIVSSYDEDTIKRYKGLLNNRWKKSKWLQFLLLDLLAGG